MKNHYQTLGLTPQASHEEIKKAYFDLAKKYHPDAGDAAEVRKFHELTEAYKTLTDKELRQAYDLSLKSGLEQIDHVEEELTQKNPADPLFSKQKRESYRDEELREFHQNRFKKAVFRVILLSIIFSLLGAFFGILLEHPTLITGTAGLLIGLSLSIRKNFDLSSFFPSAKQQKKLKLLLWFAMTVGILYFVGLILFSILSSG